MFDLRPATDALADVVQGTGDEQLRAATPCAETTVAALLDHVDGFCQAFTAVARREPLPSGAGSPPDASRLGANWRPRLRSRLDALADAWGDASAWDGLVAGPGQEMKASVAAAIALDEVLVHGWDLAMATGQRFDPDDALVGEAIAFVEPTARQHPEGVPGLFGPAVPVAADASLFDRLLGLTGRDPAWRVRG